ncbi:MULTISPECIES: hypothetical protein [unclassified Leifsonia]|uniref:hypothetical protein n=1 Tax=unclassified Leifsonia TaxID=2663824 RepID=UPI000365EB08|nr:MULTISPECIES: hypothetical protein [unclassified Leifsonia]TDP99842.1 hypothetical protein AXZ95_3772 [Leifsonia sp. 115AMFTsu3.1]
MIVAAVLSFCYSFVLTLLAAALVVQWVTGQGTIGNLTSNAANRGVAFLVVVCVGGAIALAAGAGNAVRGRRGLSAIIPLAVLVLFGLIGESIDIASGNPLLDNLIGAAIIVAAAVPLVLLLLPRRLHVDSREPSTALGTLP